MEVNMFMIGPYQIIGSEQEQSDIADSEQLAMALSSRVDVHFDTNVAIDVEHFYFGNGRVDKEGLKALLSAIANQRSASLHYGFALAEVARSRTDMHEPRTRRLLYAMNKAKDWNSTQIDSIFANRHAPINRDKRWLRSPALDMTDFSNPLPYLLSSYGPLLYLMHLLDTQKTWRNREFYWPLREYLQWLTDSFGTRGAYVIAMGVALLGRDSTARNAVRLILKFGGRESPDELADKAWNAAWDVWYIRLADLSKYGGLPGMSPRNALVVTRNRDPWFIRASAAVAAVIADGSDNAALVAIKQFSDTDIGQLESILGQDVMDIYRRQHRKPAVSHEQGLAAVQELELRMGVTRTTHG